MKKFPGFACLAALLLAVPAFAVTPDTPHSAQESEGAKATPIYIQVVVVKDSTPQQIELIQQVSGAVTAECADKPSVMACMLSHAIVLQIGGMFGPNTAIMISPEEYDFKSLFK